MTTTTAATSVAETKATGADAITAEIVRNGVVAITDEMKTNLMRTAYNMIVYEALDFTVGLFDAKGNTISIGLGLPMFIRGLSDAIKAKLEFYGPDGITPRRHPPYQRFLYHGEPPEPHDFHRSHLLGG